MTQITKEKDDAEWMLTDAEREVLWKITGVREGASGKQLLAREAVNFTRQCQLAEELARKSPDLGWTALLIAGDLVSAERAALLVQAGIPPLKAIRFVGSFARFDFAVTHLPDELLFPRLCQLWQGADPDDTNPLYLNVWVRAYLAGGGRYLRDGKPLPRTKHLTIWRGQMPGAEIGFAWSLSKKVAQKFQRGASFRRPVNGVLLSAQVKREDVLGYVTGRSEDEVIVPPKKLIDPGLMVMGRKVRM